MRQGTEEAKTARGLESEGENKNGRIHESRTSNDRADESLVVIGICATRKDHRKDGQRQEMKRWMR